MNGQQRPAALAAIGSTPVVRLTRLAAPDMAEVDSGLKYLAGDLYR